MVEISKTNLEQVKVTYLCYCPNVGNSRSHALCLTEVTRKLFPQSVNPIEGSLLNKICTASQNGQGSTNKLIYKQ